MFTSERLSQSLLFRPTTGSPTNMIPKWVGQPDYLAPVTAKGLQQGFPVCGRVEHQQRLLSNNEAAGRKLCIGGVDDISQQIASQLHWYSPLVATRPRPFPGTSHRVAPIARFELPICLPTNLSKV